MRKKDMMVVGREGGVINFEGEGIKEKGGVEGGKILLVDREEGGIY